MKRRAMLNRLAPTLTCAVWLTASLAAAQTRPAPAPSAVTAVEPLTVRALPGAPREVEKLSRNFVQTYAAPTARLDQFARWHDPVCVAVTGLQAEQAATVTARTEDVAKALGLKVASSGCKTNIEIVFADQPQRVLDDVAAHSDSLLGFHHPSETKALKTVTRPIQAWYKTASRGGGGNNAGIAFAIYNSGGKDGQGKPESVPGGRLPGVTTERETVDNPLNGVPTGCGDSRLATCLQSVFKNVLVVVDSGRVKGRELGPVSDYLAMLALSQPRTLDGCAGMPSVIDLYAPNCPGRSAPEGLTPADSVYLTALYAADAEEKKGGQQSDISGRMAKMLIAANLAASKAQGGGDPSDSAAKGQATSDTSGR